MSVNTFRTVMPHPANLESARDQNAAARGGGQPSEPWRPTLEGVRQLAAAASPPRWRHTPGAEGASRTTEHYGWTTKTSSMGGAFLDRLHFNSDVVASSSHNSVTNVRGQYD